MTKLNVAQAEFVRGLAEQIREYVRPLHERVKALEAKATPEWKGVYQHGQAYVEANLVTHAGGLWMPGATRWKSRATKAGP